MLSVTDSNAEQIRAKGVKRIISDFRNRDLFFKFLIKIWSQKPISEEWS
jgi:hypothetical protein